MKNQTNVPSSIPSTRQKLPLHLTIWTWIAAVGLSIWAYFTLRPYQHGLEWLGTPLFGLPLLALLVTAYYLIVQKKAFRWTVHVLVYLIILFVVTAANMLTFATYILSGWRSFLYLPLICTFESLLVFLGIHISQRVRSRGALFLYLFWTIVLFIVTGSTFALFYLAFHSLWRVGISVGVGFVFWIGSLLVAYGYRARFASSPDALACWAWGMVLGAGVSIIPGYLLLTMKLVPLYATIGTIIFALVVTALRLTGRQRLLTQ